MSSLEQDVMANTTQSINLRKRESTVQLSVLTMFNREDKLVPAKSTKKGKNTQDKQQHLQIQLEQTAQPSGRNGPISARGGHSNNASKSQSNFMSNTVGAKKQQEIAEPDTSMQEGQDTLILMGESKLMDLQSIDESLINDENTKNIIHAIKIRKGKSDHSDFYYLLDKVNDRIYMYKSLFLDKKPRFIKSFQANRVSSQELLEKRIKEIEEEKRQKILQHIKVKQKKNQFYDNLSKKTGKMLKLPPGIQRNGITIEQLQLNSTCDFEDLEGKVSTQQDFDLLQTLMKEQARKEKLYAQRPKMQKLERDLEDVNEDSRTRLGSQKLQLQQQTSEMTVRNDISYLSSMKRNASLPYLKHIQVKDDVAPFQKYLKERQKDLEDKMDSDQKALRRKKKLILQGAKKFLKLNQKSQVRQSLEREGGIKAIPMPSIPGLSLATTQRSIVADGCERTDKIYNRVISLPFLKQPHYTTQNVKSSQLKEIMMNQSQTARNTQGKAISNILKNFRPKNTFQSIESQRAFSHKRLSQQPVRSSKKILL